MHRLNKKYGVLILCVLAFFAFTAESCDDSGPSKATKQRRQAVNLRADAYSRAQSKYPVPHTENFPLRKMLVEMTKREDLDNHPWYVYVLADTGNVIGYYVAKTAPINACDFLSSTEDVHEYGTNDAPLKLTAPSIDGIYYGGSGASGGCNVFVFQDYSTNAIVQIGDVKYFVADKPLNLDAEAIKVAK